MTSFCLATSGTSMVTVCSRRSAPQQISSVSSLGRSRGLLHQFMAAASPWQVRGLRPRRPKPSPPAWCAPRHGRNQRSEMGSVSRILRNRLSALSLPGSPGLSASPSLRHRAPQRSGEAIRAMKLLYLSGFMVFTECSSGSFFPHFQPSFLFFLSLSPHRISAAMYSDLVHLKTMLVGMFDDTAITDAMISQGQTLWWSPADCAPSVWPCLLPVPPPPSVSVGGTQTWAAGARLRGAAGRRESALGSLGALVCSAMAASCVDGPTRSRRLASVSRRETPSLAARTP